MSGRVQVREVPNPDTASDGELDLGAVGRALWRKKWWVLIPALVVAVVTFIGVNLITPRFKSEARVLIDTRENVFLRPEAEKTAERERVVVDPEAVQSQVQLVLSRDLARQVIKQLKLNEKPEFDPVLRGFNPLRQVLLLVGLAKDPLRMTPEERILESYYDRVNAYPVDKSRVIAIEFQSADPELAARGANAIAEGYLELQQTVKQDQTRAAGRWLAGEIEVLRSKVADAEAKVEDFRSKSNLFVGTNNNTLSNQQLAEVNSQLAVARSQRVEADAKARSIRDMLKSGRAIETGDVAASELIRRLNEQRVTLRAQLAEQSSTLLDAHPRIKELKAQIADLERQIRAEAEKLVRSLENDAKISAARVAELSQNFDQLKRQAAGTNEQDVQLRALEREAKAQRDLLESYLAKYREASARENLGATPADARIISRAIVSNTPHFPKKLPIVLIATLATLLLGAGFITTGELLAGNVYRPGLLAHSAVLVPEAARAERGWLPADQVPPVASAELPGDAGTPGGGTIENLAKSLHAAGESAGRIVVAGLAEGAETAGTAIALARALAAHGRVVMVDLAFASPKLAAAAADGPAAGIADLVRATASFGQIIARDRSSRAHVIGAGRVGADGAAVLASERLAIAIDALGRSYEHVVIDMGAMPEVPADRLARLAQQAVLVTAGATREVVQMARDELTQVGFAGVHTVDGAAAAAEAPAASPVGAVAA
jgi:succinoglycan biosynthesis transport protein ExoP